MLQAAKRHKPSAVHDQQLHNSSAEQQALSPVAAGGHQHQQNVHPDRPSGTSTSTAHLDTSLLDTLADAASADGSSKDIDAGRLAGMRDKYTTQVQNLKAAHAAEIKGLQAQVAQGRAEHTKMIEENARLVAQLYDFKTGHVSSD